MSCLRRNGYDPYHGRSRGRTALKILIVILLVALALSVAALLFLEPYIRYSSDGVRVELPPIFQSGGETEPDEPAGSVPIQVVTPKPTPTPTPEPEETFRGLSLSLEKLEQADTLLEEAGATAAILPVKTEEGSLNYQSQTTWGTSSTQTGINDTITDFTGGDLYTAAYLSCFRDNTLPRTDRALSIHSSSGNWWDDEQVRWISPLSEQARAYVVQVCAETAALGFDELILDSCSFPDRGTVSAIKTDSNYASDARTQTMETFFQELETALKDYPELKLSVVTSLEVLRGEDDGSGLTLELLERYADRVLVALPEGETAPELDGLEVVPIVTAGAETGSWAILEQKTGETAE